MTFKQFVREVESHARVECEKDALLAIRATLMTFGECLSEGEAALLARDLPVEISDYLLSSCSAINPPTGEIFFDRVARREGVDVFQAAGHARAVIGTMQKAFHEKKLVDEVLDSTNGQILSIVAQVSSNAPYTHDFTLKAA